MSFADLELLRQGGQLEPLLQAICDFLDQQPRLVERVRRDLVCGLKAPEQKAAALTHWVRKKIRYVSFVSSTHCYTPSKPAVVLEKPFHVAELLDLVGLFCGLGTPMAAKTI